jgi:hypothetical protein
MNIGSRQIAPKMSLDLMQSILLRTRYRIAQGIDSLVPRVPADRGAILAAVLSPEQQLAFLNLSSVDQAHLLRVYRAVKQADPSASRDLLVAALLHDIGKVSPEGRVRLPHRVLRVALAKFAPSLWRRLSALPARGWRTGFVLAQHHAVLGAQIADHLDCSARTCWLIEQHGTRSFPIEDQELRRLVEADYHAR